MAFFFHGNLRSQKPYGLLGTGKNAIGNKNAVPELCIITIHLITVIIIVTFYVFMKTTCNYDNDQSIAPTYNATLLPSVHTVARGMFCRAKYTHHTFTPIIKHYITKANKHPGKK